MSSVHALARRWWAGELAHGGRLLSLALAPAEAVYRLAAGVRNRAFDRGLLPAARATVPAISIGNIAVGGTGKTPFASWLARRLRAEGQRPAILHGGHAGDEPALHRRWTPDIPVFEQRERSAAAARAIALGATVLILDDAFQHRRMHRDLDIVLIAAERWRLPARLLPRGPWREPPSALGRAHVIVVTRKTASLAVARQAALDIETLSGCASVLVHLHAARWQAVGSAPAASAPPAPAVLVSGIAEPALFAGSARAAGAVLAEELIFDDHHDYTAADVQRIIATAAGRPIVTTEKDWTKLERWLEGAAVWLLELDVVVEAGGGTLDRALRRVLP
jgi:tetraacyldisaccharide 4'-kinase